MATKYVRAAGGAWGAAATWALTSGGTEVTTVPTAADDVVTDSNSGASTVDANISVKSFVQTGTPGAVTNNGFTISSAGNVTLLSGKYIAASNAARISITAAGTLTTGGNAMGGVTLAAAAVCGDNLTFIADKLCTLILNGNFLDVNGKTISGNSATNRLLIRSVTVGTPRTVTVAGGSFANCDFQDIAFNNGGADLDLSAITGGSGNCGGNSMSGGGVLTFTAPTTQTFASIGGNWSDSAKWTSRVPLPQDLARFQPMSAGQTITVDMPRLPDTDFSGCGSSNLPSVALTTTGLTYSIYGSLNLTGIAAGGWTCTKTFTFAGRSNATLTSNGKQIINNGAAFLQIQMPGCNLSLNDAIITGDRLTLQNGNLITNNYSVTAPNLFSTVGTNIVSGSSIFTLTGSGAPWNVSGTVTAGTSIITITYTGTIASVFNGGTNTYNDITIAPGAGVLTFSGAFTFHDMTMSSAGTRSIVFTKGTTYTMTGDSFLNGAGVDDAPIISPSLLNGGFETAGAGGADVFADWGEVYAGTSTINRDTSDKYAGDASCRFDIAAAGTIVRITTARLTIGKIYKLSFYAKISSVTAFENLFIIGATTYASFILTTEYKKYECYFLADNTTLAIRNGSTSVSKSIWIDDVTLTPLNSVLIQSSGAGEPFTLSKASGLIASNYLAIKDSIATGGATWLAGYESTNISGNTGWHFNSPAIPSPAVITVNASTATAKALCRGVPAAASVIVNASVATAKAICRGIPTAAVINVLATCSFIIATWSDNLFKATERYVGQYFKASKRRK